MNNRQSFFFPPFFPLDVKSHDNQKILKQKYN